MTAGAGADSGLAAVARLASALPGVPWFGGLGRPPVERERGDATLYLSELGFSASRLAWAPDWAAARAVTQDKGWSRAWWEAEEAERQALLVTASEICGEAALMAALDSLLRASAGPLMAAAARAAAAAGVEDEALPRVAAGAASQGCYQAALALAAGAGETHAFAAKHRLFAAGRWPLGLIGDRFHVF